MKWKRLFNFDWHWQLKLLRVNISFHTKTLSSIDCFYGSYMLKYSNFDEIAYALYI